MVRHRDKIRAICLLTAALCQIPDFASAQDLVQVHIVQGMPKKIRSVPENQGKVLGTSQGSLQVIDFQGPFQAEDLRRFNWIRVRDTNYDGWIPADWIVPEQKSVERTYVQMANGWAWQTLHLLKDGNFLFYQTSICQEDGPIQFTQTSTLTGKWRRERLSILLVWGPESGPGWSLPDPSPLNQDLKKTQNRRWTWEFPETSDTIKMGGVVLERKLN